jgi:hypothetical protein
MTPLRPRFFVEILRARSGAMRLRVRVSGPAAVVMAAVAGAALVAAAALQLL